MKQEYGIFFYWMAVVIKRGCNLLRHGIIRRAGIINAVSASNGCKFLS